MKRTNSVDETAARYRAMPLWLISPPVQNVLSSAPGRKTQPIPPRLGGVEKPPAARRSPGGQVAGLCALAIQAAEITLERETLVPFYPPTRISTIESRVKPDNPGGLRALGPVAVVFQTPSRAGAGREFPTGREVKLPPAIAPEPRPQSEAWRAAPIRPSNPIATSAVSLPFLPQAGTATRISRPQPALRELVFSPLPASSRKAATPAARYGQFVFPTPHAVAHAIMPDSFSADIWKTESASDLKTNRFVRESQEFRPKNQLSLEGGRTPLAKVKPVAIREPFPAGLIAPFQNQESRLPAGEPSVKIESPNLPSPIPAFVPRPVVALSTGLVVWSGVFNSYVRRIVCSPKLRDSVRDVHALRLAPTKTVHTEFKTSDAGICRSTETLPISDSGSEMLAGKGEVDVKARIEYAEPRRA